MKKEIARQMTIEEIFTNFPSKSGQLAQEMLRAGLHCVGCSAAVWETLEEGMQSHGMTEEQIETLVAALNAILQQPEEGAAIVLTERAAQKYGQILAEEGKSGWGLRFGERAAGCKGFEHFLDFSAQAADNDEIFQSHGIEIHVQKQSLPRLMGSVIDYVDNGLHGTGFKIANPNIHVSCGCGNSHSYQEDAVDDEDDCLEESHSSCCRRNAPQ